MFVAEVIIVIVNRFLDCRRRSLVGRIGANFGNRRLQLACFRTVSTVVETVVRILLQRLRLCCAVKRKTLLNGANFRSAI